MRKKFAYTETLSSTGGKNIALPGIGEISEAKMMLAMIVIIFGFIIHASLQVHLAAFLAGLAVLAIPETSVGFDKTLVGVINYYFGKNRGVQEGVAKGKVREGQVEVRTEVGAKGGKLRPGTKPPIAKKPAIPSINAKRIIKNFFGNYWQSVAGVVLTVGAIYLANVNIVAYFAEVIVLLVLGLVLFLVDYLNRMIKK